MTPKANAMKSSSLTQADRGHLTSALETRRTALRIDVKAQMDGSDDERVVGLRNRLQESGDEWGVAEGLAELDIAELQHGLAELGDVDAALARLRDGTYGVCTDCGEAIAPARLFAYPTATRCVVCQAAWEKKSGGPPVTAV
jgi:DnaK suppressor protein